MQVAAKKVHHHSENPSLQVQKQNRSRSIQTPEALASSCMTGNPATHPASQQEEAGGMVIRHFNNGHFRVSPGQNLTRLFSRLDTE